MDERFRGTPRPIDKENPKSLLSAAHEKEMGLTHVRWLSLRNVRRYLFPDGSMERGRDGATLRSLVRH